MTGHTGMHRRQWLEDAIARRGLTRTALADMLGVNASSISHWILGRFVPGQPARKLLALYLGLSEDEVQRGFADIRTDTEAAA